MRLRLLVELAPPLAAMLAAWWLPRVAPGVWAIPSGVLRRFARTPRQAVIWAAVLSFAVGPFFSWASPPAPHVHDEFSYLLAADTFAQGRLTNPTHPMWEHFETFHVIHTPTYQSKYPPGQALFLAAGQALTGRPIVGVWLSVAAGGAAVCWMLLGFAPPRWALFGGLLPALRFGTLPLWDEYIWFGYWNTTYWGGALAMAGGALLLGALARLLRKPRPQDGMVFAAGLIVLANSRPFEGLLVAVAAALPLGWWWIRRPAWRGRMLRVLAPAAGVLAVGALAMGYYHYRLTGNPLKMPYLVYEDQYETVPFFSFEPLLPDKTFRHEMFHVYNVMKRQTYVERSEASGVLHGVWVSDLTTAVIFFGGYVLWLPMLWLLLRPWDPWAVFCCGLILLLLFVSSYTVQPRLHLHYMAPAVPAFVVLAVAGVRRARAFRLKGRRAGRAMAEAAVAVSLALFVPACMLRAHYGPHHPTRLSRYRPQVIASLQAAEGYDLVLVTYGPDHIMYQDWVYNGADLEDAPILWARDMGREKNREIVEYYAGRRVWRLYADENPPRLEPYEEVP
jgi:hypothetical protein